jgi:uncharacterized Zn-finger protein
MKSGAITGLGPPLAIRNASSAQVYASPPVFKALSLAHKSVCLQVLPSTVEVSFVSSMSQPVLQSIAQAQVPLVKLKSEEPATCPICAQVCVNPYVLKTHHLTVHEKIRFPCEICPAKLGTSHALRRHLKIKHPAAGEKLKSRAVGMEKPRFPCTICGQLFTRSNNLKTHKLAVHEKVRFKCEVCSFTSGYKDNLSAHVQGVHQKIRSYCQFCPRNYSTTAGLRTHQVLEHPSELMVQTPVLES